ncbi:hypothetical protein BDR06DRAFT_561398 [Suillus hirtellus]|nr:hypothetical protein BDR06DRAFT_561398 [Suillus hirtellus]
MPSSTVTYHSLSATSKISDFDSGTSHIGVLSSCRNSTRRQARILQALIMWLILYSSEDGSPGDAPVFIVTFGVSVWLSCLEPPILGLLYPRPRAF